MENNHEPVNDSGNGSDAVNDPRLARLIRWEEKKRMWYMIYLFIGVGICFILYFTKPYGFDPGTSFLWGNVFGLGIPLATIFILSFIHQKILSL
ncbi:hypothetical protein QUF76_05270 [Desulfobacterales bacterium HSG16]|nr:hypothetical protein [Desulfobacterales bacterium HSG16]